MGKVEDISLKLRFRYLYNLLLHCDQYWIPQNYVVLRESIFGSIEGSTQGSPLGSGVSTFCTYPRNPDTSL